MVGKQKDTSGAATGVVNLTNTSATYVNGVTTVYFSRPLNVGENPIVDPSNVLIICSADETNQNLVYHSCTCPTSFTLDFVGGTGQRGGNNNPQRNTHGVLMLVGWGIFIPLGMIVARYGRKTFPDGLWFEIHRGLMSTGLLLTTSAFIIAWVMTQGVFFNTSFHAQLGLTITILGYLQFFSGVIRPHKEEGEEATDPRKVFEIVHPNTGRLLIALAVINIFAGISTWWPYYANVIYATCVLFPLAVIIGLAEVTKAGGDETA